MNISPAGTKTSSAFRHQQLVLTAEYTTTSAVGDENTSLACPNRQPNQSINRPVFEGERDFGRMFQAKLETPLLIT